MNRNEFQHVAKQFRAGKISLDEFTDRVLTSEGGQTKSLPSETSAAKAGVKQESDGDRSNEDWLAPGERDQLVERLLKRPVASHKGDFGRVLVIAGSRGMAGAAGLTAMAAIRSGAGLVTVATPSSCQATVAGFNPCLMTVGLPETGDGVIAASALPHLTDLAAASDAVALGPGLGTDPELDPLVAELYATIPNPTVIDADGLNALSRQYDSPHQFPTTKAARVLTPHPGEFRRLVGERGGLNRAEMCDLAVQFALEIDATVVLKGHRTLVSDGRQSWYNPTGNPGMASGGSGDVLTGVIAAFLAAGLAPRLATQAACYIHGAAGDRAAQNLTQAGLSAIDIVQCLPGGTRKLLEHKLLEHPERVDTQLP